MQVNRRIVVGALIIMAAGSYRVLVLKQGGTLTRVLVGGYLLAVAASLFDLLGGSVASIAGGILWVAVIASLLAVGPDFVSRLSKRG